MFATYLSDTDSTWMQSQERRHKRRIELADPYFLPYSKPEHSPVNPRKICSNISASDPADNKRSFRVTVRQSVIVKHRTDIIK